jgi:hypothetical protein
VADLGVGQDESFTCVQHGGGPRYERSGGQ